MTPLTALWLPILLSGVIVFIASSIIHMFLKWHDTDYSAVPEEAKLADAIRPFAIPPGDYMVPRPKSMEEMRSPEFAEKKKGGPVMVMTVFPNGVTGMGAQLFLWFLYTLVVSSSRPISPAARSHPAASISRCSASPGRPRSSAIRSRSGRCRSGTGAAGARRSSRRSTD